MPRRGSVPKRETQADPLYGSALITKFVSVLMRGGKKSGAESILYRALDLLKERTQDDPLKSLKKAVDNVKPTLEVKSRRVGGSTYQVPIEVNPRRRESLAIRWIVSYARLRGEKTMKEKLAAEIQDAAAEKGAAIKKKEDIHRMAEANRAFAHYRW